MIVITKRDILVGNLTKLALDKGVGFSWNYFDIHRMLKLSFNFNNLVRHKILSDNEINDCTDVRALACRIMDDVWDDIKRRMNVPVELPNRMYITTGRGGGKTWIQERMYVPDKGYIKGRERTYVRGHKVTTDEYTFTKDKSKAMVWKTRSGAAGNAKNVSNFAEVEEVKK